MKFEIIKQEFENTGGNCMVLFCKIRLLDEDKVVYTTSCDYVSSIYESEEDGLLCYEEDSIDTLWADNIAESDSPYKVLHLHLFATYDELEQQMYR